MTPSLLFHLFAMTTTASIDDGTCSSKPYRAGVVALFRRSESTANFDADEILLCKRKGSGEWQIPQGGSEGDETTEETLMREMMEELGTTSFRIVKKAQKSVSYDFPAGMKGKYTSTHRGQQHTWFLLEFDDGYGPNLDLAADKEFDECRWVVPSRQSILDKIISWKQNAYIEGFSQLGYSLH